MNVYKSGSLVESDAFFVNRSGQPADPTTITFKYRAANGSVTTIVYPAAGITKDAVGAYHSTVDTTGWTGPGLLLYTSQWQGTGNVVALDDDFFQVEPAAL